MNYRISSIKLASSFCTLSRSVLLAFCAAVVVGCGPRGESHTLDEVFSDARTAYKALSGTAVPEGVSTALKRVAIDLDKLAGIGGGGDAKEVSQVVADTIDELIPKSGMTQRAAMTELVNQYRAVRGSAAVSLGAPHLKLLVARTYTLLSSELISTKFGL